MTADLLVCCGSWMQVQVQATFLLWAFTAGCLSLSFPLIMVKNDGGVFFLDTCSRRDIK